MTKAMIVLFAACVLAVGPGITAGGAEPRPKVVQYQVRGRVLDSLTHQPVAGVKVILTLDENEGRDPELIDRVLKMADDKNSDRRPGGGPLTGISGSEGHFIARIRQRVPVRLKGEPPHKVFPHAWLVLGKIGYQSNTAVFSTEGWTQSDWNWEQGMNDLPDQYIMPACNPVEKESD